MSKHKIKKVVLNGEANDLSDDEYLHIITKWKLNVLDKCIIDNEITSSSIIYNADETSLFHNKLPNTIFMEVQKVDKRLHGSKVYGSKEKLVLWSVPVH